MKMLAAYPYAPFLLLLLILLPACASSDESAITDLLEKESATWRARDVAGHADCWLIQPYSRILVSTADGRTFDIPPEAMVYTSPDKMGDGGTSSNSNYKFSIHDNNAWVSHDEVSIAPNGNKSYSYEIRLLEKVDGQWKLVGQSIHGYRKE